MTVLPSRLAAATEWRADTLELDGATTASWARLAREAGRGTIGSIRVREESLREAREEDIRALWSVTEGEWESFGGVKYAMKSDGEAGIKKLLKIAQEEEERIAGRRHPHIAPAHTHIHTHASTHTRAQPRPSA